MTWLNLICCLLWGCGLPVWTTEGAWIQRRACFLRTVLNLTSQSSRRSRQFCFRDWPHCLPYLLDRFWLHLLSWLVWGKVKEKEEASCRELMVVVWPLRTLDIRAETGTVPGKWGCLATLLAQEPSLCPLINNCSACRKVVLWSRRPGK